MIKGDRHFSSTINAIFCRLTQAGKQVTTSVTEAHIVYNGIKTVEGEGEDYEDADKALLHYATQHYHFWQQQNPAYNALLANPGVFGENIASTGLSEHNLCIGDIISLGSSKVQITMGRDACQTMDRLFGCATMSQQMHEHHKTGWFYKVLQEGTIKLGEQIVVLERPNPQWTIARVQAYRYQQTVASREILATLANLPHLSQPWRTTFAERLALLS